MVRFESVLYRMVSCAAMILLVYWIAGWDLKEPCSVYILMIIFLSIQDWMIDKRRALQRGRANRAGIAIKSIT